MRSENISIYDKAKVFDEVIYKIKALHLEERDQKNKSGENRKGWERASSIVDDINLHTLESLITENLSTSTMITTSAPDEDLR